MSASDRKPSWLAWLCAILLARLLLMVVLPLTDTSEPRYAEIARLMAESGDWITPWFDEGVPFWGKPPLAFWASAWSFRLLGYSDFAARLPSWLATVPTLYLIYRYARQGFNPATARLAVLIYTSSLLPFVSAGAVLTDPYLTLAVTLSLVSFSKLMENQDSAPIWKFNFFLGLGLGLLSKGPLAIVIVLGVLLPWTLWRRPSMETLKRIPWASGIALSLTISLPWYVLAESKTPGFLNYFLLGEHLYRFLDPGWQGDLYGSAHQRIHGSIWLDGLLASLPWGVIALWQLISWKRDGGHLRKPKPESSDAQLVYLLLWMLVTPLLFTLSGNILWTYVQPSLPAFALLLAIALIKRQPLASTSWPYLMWTALVPLAGITLSLWFSAHPQQIKSEKALIETFTAHAQAQQPLYYLQQRPFSARYYSHGQAKSGAGNTPIQLVEQYPDGVYLAVPPEHMDTLKGLALSPVLFKNRRYALLFARAKKP